MINKTKKSEKPVAKMHKNFMDGESYFISDPIKNLRIAASTCFFGEPMYYHRGKGSSPKTVDLGSRVEEIVPAEWRRMTPTQLMETAIDRALDFDPEQTLQEAIRLRNDEHIRTTPQVILVRAAHHPKVRGTNLIRMYAPKIIQRADEPSTGLAYHFATYGKNAPIPNSLKKAFARALEGFTSHQLAKYKMGDREVKTVDVVNLVHPKGDAFKALTKGQLKLDETTWESLISSRGSNTKSWAEATKLMGHMALLRNLRNLVQNNVDPDLYLPKLISTAKSGKQLPFRYYSAYKALLGVSSNPRILDAVEKCLKESLGNMPHFKGRLMALSDNSGSAHGAMTSEMGSMKVADIGNLSSILAAKCADEGYVGVFGDKLIISPIRQSSSIFDDVSRIDKHGMSVGGSTENGVWIFWRDAIKNKEHWDNVFIFSDQQAGHGGLYGVDPREYRDYNWSTRYIDVASLIKKYRQDVNPNVNVFLVQTAGYQDTIVPEFYKRTYILGGWGEGLLRFAAEMNKLY